MMTFFQKLPLPMRTECFLDLNVGILINVESKEESTFIRIQIVMLN